MRDQATLTVAITQAKANITNSQTRAFPKIIRGADIHIYAIRCYMGYMSTQPPNRKTPPSRGGAGKTVTLSDGRKLSVPPSGGNFSKREIRKAVQSALSQKSRKAKTG